MRGFSLTLIPLSWAIGKWTIRDKTLWAFGPFRFGIHRNLGSWRNDGLTKPVVLKVMGSPMSDVGLENAILVLENGTIERFEGFIVQQGQSVHQAVLDAIPKGASLYPDMETYRRIQNKDR